MKEANFYNIDKNAHYFVLMHPLEGFGFFAFTSSSTREKWVECKIVEDRYKVDDGYKVTLKSIEDGYGWEHFYQSDFKSMLRTGSGIVKKESAKQHVEEVFFVEPLTAAAYLVHSAYIITE